MIQIFLLLVLPVLTSALTACSKLLSASSRRPKSSSGVHEVLLTTSVGRSFRQRGAVGSVGDRAEPPLRRRLLASSVRGLDCGGFEGGRKSRRMGERVGKRRVKSCVMEAADQGQRRDAAHGIATHVMGVDLVASLKVLWRTVMENFELSPAIKEMVTQRMLGRR